MTQRYSHIQAFMIASLVMIDFFLKRLEHHQNLLDVRHLAEDHVFH